MAWGQRSADRDGAVRLQGYVMARICPPKPPSRPDNINIISRLRLFRQDMFRSQPNRLYRAWMAQQGAPGFQSVLVNDPALVEEVLTGAPQDFPKAHFLRTILAPLLGRSVFVTNGAEWAAQRAALAPAFAEARLTRAIPHMQAAGVSALKRLHNGPCEMEAQMSHLASDIIFRIMFSRPIEDHVAMEVFNRFQAYQRVQPLLAPMDLLDLPRWLPRHRRGKAEARKIRALLAQMAQEHERDDDLVAEMKRSFSGDALTDQLAIMFLAGHETSASALAWALWCLAADPEAQEQVRREAAALPDLLDAKALRQMPFTRDVVREVLRLYPPVPMLPREMRSGRIWRGRPLKAGSLAILSPWHLHRHERLWPDPHLFDPWRWQRSETEQLARRAYIPFSKGPRVCIGASLAMAEAVMMLGLIVRAFALETTRPDPVPVAHLTVRAEAGIHLRLTRRS